MPVDSTQTEQQTDQGDAGTQDAELAFDTWYTALDEKTKSMIDAQLEGVRTPLATSLQSERERGKNLEKQLRALSKTTEQGSELQAQITKMADDVKQESSKAAFFESAHDAGIKNLRLAYVAAKDFGVVGEDGKTDFTKLKELAPELFVGAKVVVPAGNAGAGAGQQGGAKPDMNSFMRRAAGYN